MNDLKKPLAKKCKMVQYAENTLLFCDDIAIQNFLQLMQKSCQKLSSNFLKYSIKLNTNKTELMIFSKRHQGRNYKTNFRIMFDDNQIEVQPQVKYLRVIPVRVEVEKIFK